MKKIAINGYGTIGKRVADAVSVQPDMEIVGVVKTRPSYEAKMALEKGYTLYASKPEEIEAFQRAGLEVAGSLKDLLGEADLVVDCTPGGVGAKNKEAYVQAGVKAIWQGGEEHELAGFSFNSEANYEKCLGRDFTRVVSCNTTGLVRVLYALDTAFGVEKARVTLMRRAADPNDIKKGPINAIVPDPITLPSHHGPDVKSVLPHINITTTAVKLPTTLMHLHALNLTLKKEVKPEDVIKLFQARPRLRLIEQWENIKSTAEAMEMAKDMGRPRGDHWENIIWQNSISTDKDGELYFFQAIHQESDVVPENIDAIRAMLELEKNGEKSIEKTNKALGIPVAV